jgi:hypothetical protein
VEGDGRPEAPEVKTVYYSGTRMSSVQQTTIQLHATLTDKTWYCLLHKTTPLAVTVNITQVISCGLAKTLVKYNVGGTAAYLAY